jgi:uncharacterized protein YhhL (DUF1145 family)
VIVIALIYIASAAVILHAVKLPLLSGTLPSDGMEADFEAGSEQRNLT